MMTVSGDDGESVNGGSAGMSAKIKQPPGRLGRSGGLLTGHCGLVTRSVSQ